MDNAWFRKTDDGVMWKPVLDTGDRVAASRSLKSGGSVTLEGHSVVVLSRPSAES